ncbi:MAG: Franean1_4349 family RiPP [Candidatus Ancaeobacter aquaticus]|nr:Franean1_4349 family RiPP [Candidatus Ancaeobacter aquaticus]
MSKQGMEKIFGKAVTDEVFRGQLLSDPDSALAGSDLSEDEIQAIKAMDKESIEKFVGGLDERISKRGNRM